MMNKPNLIIYGDLLSQPTRSVVVFCKLNNIPYEFKIIRLDKGEHLSEEYKKINPNSKVPAISLVENKNKQFNLAESCAILRFLADYYKVDEKWYPRNDIYRRALIDEALDWHHLNTRITFSSAVFSKLFAPILAAGGIKRNVPNTEKHIPKMLKILNNTLANRKYIVDNEISIADLIYSCEITQLELLGIDFIKYPNLNDYLNRMNSCKEMKNVNVNLYKLKQKRMEKNPKF